MNLEHPWFHYEQSPAGRFTAIPVSWEGWAASIALIAVTVVFARYMPGLLQHFMPTDFARPIGIAGPLLACFGAFFVLVKTKGRRF